MPSLYYREDDEWKPLGIGDVISGRFTVATTNAYSYNFDEPFAGVPRVVAMAVGTQEVAVTGVSESGFVVDIQSGTAPCDIMYLAAYEPGPYDNYTGEELLDDHLETCKTNQAAAQRVSDYFNTRFTSMSWAYMSKMSEVAAAFPAVFGVYVNKTRTVNMGSSYGGSTVFRVAGVDHDTNSSGKGAFTFIADKCIATHQMNTSNTTNGGWANCAMRSWLSGTVLPAMPSDLRTVIASVNKVNTSGYGTSPTQDKLWIPSYTEVGLGGNEGSQYNIFTDNSSRIRKYNNSNQYWWLRSVASSTTFRGVDPGGALGNYTANRAHGVVPGFCI